MNLDLKTMNPETAKSLFFEGATLVILGVPKGTEFGIDMKVWNTDDKFRGFKMIPPGVHFVHYSAVSNTGNLAPRSGFFYNFKLAEFVVKMYDCKNEDISDKVVRECEVVKLKENLVQLDSFLAPYPYEIQDKWLGLTKYVTAELMNLLVPETGYIRSAQILMSCNDADRPRGNVIKDINEASTSTCTILPQANKRRRKIGLDESDDDLLPDLKPLQGTELRFTKFPEQNYPDGASPAEITKHSLDSTYVLDTMLHRHKNITHFIGEIQFAYICFLVGHSLEAFEHWKSLIGLLCSCDQAITKYRQIYDLFITILEPQLKEIPEEFLADIVANNNFAYIKLKQFFRTVQDCSVDGRLKSKIWRFKEELSDTYDWDFTQEEDEDDAPVVVELE